MRKLITLLLFGLLAVALIVGCGEQKEEAADDMTAGGHTEEMADSTRMDSAMVDSMAGEAVEAVQEAHDSM